MDVHTHVSDSISFPPPEPQCTIKVTSFNASGNPQTYQLGVGQKDLSLGQLASRILKEAGV